MTAPTVSAVMAIRAAVVTATAPLAWYVSVPPADAVFPCAVWAAAGDVGTDLVAFRRGAAGDAQEFSVFADATETQTAQEAAYAAFAACKAALDRQRLLVTTDARNVPIQTVRCTCVLVALLDDPERPRRAYARGRIDTTVWRA